MRKMKLAMLIVFCVMLFGGTVVSFVLPDREFSDVENRELDTSELVFERSGQSVFYRENIKRNMIHI